MKNSIFEQIGGTYYRQGDYFLPNIAVPESDPIGVWGQRHLKYIKKHHQAIYTAMLLSGELSNYLAEIDQQAGDMFSQLINQLALQAGVTETLKADDQMKWVGLINTCKAQAEEIVSSELIYV